MLYRPLKLRGIARPRHETWRSLRRGERNAIVIALDGQATAEKALPHAVQLALVGKRLSISCKSCCLSRTGT